MQETSWAVHGSKHEKMAERNEEEEQVKVTIEISKQEAEHLKDHTFYDSCDEVDEIMRRIQKKVKNR